jgi:hypothetical protein
MHFCELGPIGSESSESVPAAIDENFPERESWPQVHLL